MSKIIGTRITADVGLNFRDVTSSPKVLLTNVVGLNRDHCWVNLTEELEKFLPKSNRQTNKISFNCKIKEYLNYRTKEVKLGIVNISNIQKV